MLLVILGGLVGLSIAVWVWLSVAYVESAHAVTDVQPDGIVPSVGRADVPAPLGAVSVFGTSAMAGLVVYKVRESRSWWWMAGVGTSVATFLALVAIHIAILLYLGSVALGEMSTQTRW